ncbi:tetratricopeptide repeat protein [Lysobacter sp. H23M47]|uniref:c-type cytochrome biogenesis protein CcmI/CycH n=1 Tax=Lysobacter sp. H23M47 TaxID=2781024 RepID=UPI001880EE23|nr:tetratricopeptide repeat protein [Lysobacter sp. H23M47]QOW25571.1 tetratricopeptide repeat protein [Lysobacter sp. H23M47]
MTVFVIAGLAMALGVMLWVLRPLWRSRPLPGIALAVLLVTSAGLIYSVVGTPRALDPLQRTAPETLADAVGQLESELARDPNQVEGWRLLARAHLAQGDIAESMQAYDRALKLAPDNPDLLAEAAEVRARSHADRSFDAISVSMLERALAQQPDHQRARWFLGIAQRQAGDAAAAVATWEPLLSQVDPATAASLRTQIDAARLDAGMEPLPEAAPVAASAVNITVSVSLDPRLAMQYPQGASVFVIARQTNGSPVPVSVKKLQAGAFPLTVTLTDNDSLMPTMKLSELEQVRLSARISASGEASARPGDFESAPVEVEAGPEVAAALLIDQVVK